MLLMPWCAECNLCSTYLQRCDGFTIWLSVRAILFVTFNRSFLSSVSVDWGRKWLINFSAGKTQLVSFDQSNWFHLTSHTGAADVKMDGSVLEKKSSFKMLGLTFFSELDWGYYVSLLRKVPPRILDYWFILWRFFLLYLYKSALWPCIEYGCHVWAGAPSWYLELVDMLQKCICKSVGPSFAACVEPLAHNWNATILSLPYRYYCGRSLSELAEPLSLPNS